MSRNKMQTQLLYVSIGESIRRHRRDACLSVANLAASCFVTTSHLQKVEVGETACSVHLLVALADVLDTTLDDLVPVQIDSKELIHDFA